MSTGPLRVFIADDSQPVAEMLTELIAAPGKVEVIGVGASESAVIDSIRRLKPDVVLLDLQLESGSGTNVVKWVRAEPELACVRLLITSNHTSPQLRAGCLELGADDYFDKVKELAALTERVEEFAAQKQRGS